MTDGDIIRSCQSGELEQFAQLYDRYAAKIYKYIYYRVREKSTAEDLTSLTFTKALENIGKYKSTQGTFSAWIYRIAKNTLIDHYRTDKNDDGLETVAEKGVEVDYEGAVDARRRLAEVEEYMQTMKPEQQEIIRLRLWDELSYQEIAEVVGKSEASCKMAFSRAIAVLRAGLAILLLFLLTQ
ncbi:MAG: sigma-70 family RNA polymerase sigma factor [Candidatus Komeilibacteria bacterium]|nr:sigma-70 family RNA polymerase sigma factor [Candidatus Komeilibacteria bacterium]